MSYCECDYEPADVYSASIRVARKTHKCRECACEINPGDRYESVFMIFDGRPHVDKTCPRCLALREWVKAHVPCFCFGHGNAREDAMNTARNWAHEAPGLLFGAYRREIAISRAQGMRWRRGLRYLAGYFGPEQPSAQA